MSFTAQSAASGGASSSPSTATHSSTPAVVNGPTSAATPGSSNPTTTPQQPQHSPHKNTIPEISKKTTSAIPKSRFVFAQIPSIPNLHALKEAQVFANNAIRTTKYTIIDFLPKNLTEQFTRIANIFFLVLVIIQFIPSLSVVNPYYNAFPLFLVITLSAIRDGYEDWKRYRSDITINSTKTTCAAGGSWHNVNVPFFERENMTKRMMGLFSRRRSSSSASTVAIQEPFWRTKSWDQLHVGDFVLIQENDSIPADVLLLSSSLAPGNCFVETKNLDGENNLKSKQSLESTRHLQNPHDCTEFHCTVECSPPDSNLYHFTGKISIAGRDPIPIDIHNLLLRGCILRNTEWVIGLVLFTGNDSKVVLNGGAAPTKISMIAKTLNRVIIINLFVVLTLCIIDSIVNPIWLRQNSNPGNPWLLSSFGASSSDFDNGFAVFWSSLNIYRNIIPISLYITIEVVQTLQAFFIYSDLGMYYEELDLPCIPRAWKLSDDLGQVSHIFSDKTGTLTQNVLKFKGCSVSGCLFRDDVFDHVNKSFLLTDLPSHAEANTSLTSFLLFMAICHTAVVTKKLEGEKTHYTYKSESPDEEALLDAARDAGFIFTSNDGGNVMHVLAAKTPMQFTLLRVLEFNSTRKRMSVIVKDAQGNIRLICKGADTVIRPRLVPNQPFEDVTYQHVDLFAVKGLRTLCLATKVIPSNEYAAWEAQYKKAALAIEKRSELIDKLANDVEKGLILLGATAVEDKLQDGVPECIKTLAEAGIILWVLTGDKIETAINIGHSCNLLRRDMQQLVISLPDSHNPNGVDLVRDQIAEALSKFPADHLQSRFALIIDGYALTHSMEGVNKERFLTLASQCKAVICARVSPLQKAEIVNCVKNATSKLTLAIGDGANDVSMIHAAHIGVGITGKEGMQATMASDYAFGQFRFLSRLLLVQGHWSYVRTSAMVLLFLHKSFIFTMILFWYQWFCGYSAELLYDFTYLLLYNVVFTLLPVGLIGTFDQDLIDSILLQLPGVYGVGIRRDLFTTLRFAIFTFESFAQSFAIFAILLASLIEASCYPNGRILDQRALGIIAGLVAIFTSNLQIGMCLNSWNILAYIAIHGSNILTIAFTAVYASIPAYSIYGINEEVLGSGQFWLVTLFCVLVCLLPRLLIMAIQREFRPTDIQIVQEIQQQQVRRSGGLHEEGPLLASAASSPASSVISTRSLPKSVPTFSLAEMEEGRLSHGRSSN